MRPITLIQAYYENAGMLTHQHAFFAAMRKDVREHLHWIVVDDGSPTAPATMWDVGLASFKLFRMQVDIPWNQDACRNLGVSQAQTKWVLLTDMDHMVPEDTLLRVMTAVLQESAVYQFTRNSVISLEPFKTIPYKHHPNTWLMTRAMYEAVGGYDERFAGHYSTDGDFAARIKARASTIERLPEHILRVPREVIPDASTTTYARKKPEDAAAIVRIKKERAESAPWRPLNGLFPWEEVRL